MRPERFTRTEPEEVREAGFALTFAVESNSTREPMVAVYEGLDGVLEVIIRTIHTTRLKGCGAVQKRTSGVRSRRPERPVCGYGSSLG